MELPINPEIYHITHLDNLDGIINAGCLWSDTQRIKQNFACTNIGYSHLKQARLTRRVDLTAGGSLGDYVPFYFCNRSVMLYIISKGHEDYSDGQSKIIHLVSSVKNATECGQPWAFTDGHAVPAYANYFDNTEHLNRINWEAMTLKYWQQYREQRQAEFLVYDWFPWSCFTQIGVVNKRMAEAVLQKVAAADHKPVVTVEPTWYY